MCVEANFLPGGPSSKIYPMIFYDIPFHTGPIPDLVHVILYLQMIVLQMLKGGAHSFDSFCWFSLV